MKKLKKSRLKAICAGVLQVKNGVTYGPEGDEVKRFGFHNLRHSPATLLMDDGENPAVVQAVMRHSKLDMTLYYAHPQRKHERAVLDKVAERFVPKRGWTGVGTGVADHERVVNLDQKSCATMTLPRSCGRLTQR